MDKTELAAINFVFRYAGHGWADAWISRNEEVAYYMGPSYVPNDPLFDLMHVLVEVMTYGGSAHCNWFYEPAGDRRILERKEDEDLLHITILGVSDSFFHPNWPNERGEVKFSAVCELWKFAAKVRLAASRLMKPIAKDYHDPTSIYTTGEYRRLCALLEEHKARTKQKHAK